MSSDAHNKQGDERPARKARPISDSRLAQLRTEVGAFHYVLSSDVVALLVRYDAAVAELQRLQPRLSTPAVHSRGTSGGAQSAAEPRPR